MIPTTILIAKPQTDSNIIYYIIAGVVGGLIIISVIVTVYCCKKKKKSDENNSKPIEITPTEEQIITETEVKLNDNGVEHVTIGRNYDVDDELPAVNLRRHDSEMPLSEESISAYY